MKFYLVSAHIRTKDGDGFASTTFMATGLPRNPEEFTDFKKMIASAFDIKIAEKDLVIISITELNEFQKLNVDRTWQRR